MKKFFVFLVILCSVTFFSCTDKVDLDPRDRDIVVHAILEDTTVQTVQLYYTSYLSENYNQPVEDAQVYIERVNQDNKVIERHNFYKVTDGVWRSNFSPVHFAIYKLTVAVPGKELMTGTTRFPLMPNFLRVKININTLDIEHFNRTKSEEKVFNYEHIVLYSYMDYIPETKSYQLATSHYHRFHHHEHDYPDYIKQHTWMFQDYKYNGKYAISRDSIYVSHYDSLKLASGSPCGGYSVLMNDMGDGYIVGAYYVGFGPARKYGEYNSQKCEHPLSYLIVRFISKEYELYIKDVIAKSEGINMKDKSDLTHLWEKDDIYSNITNGLGIFAAESKSELMVKDWQYLDYPPKWELYNITIPGWND